MAIVKNSVDPSLQGTKKWKSIAMLHVIVLFGLSDSDFQANRLIAHISHQYLGKACLNILDLKGGSWGIHDYPRKKNPGCEWNHHITPLIDWFQSFFLCWKPSFRNFGLKKHSPHSQETCLNHKVLWIFHDFPLQERCTCPSLEPTFVPGEGRWPYETRVHPAAENAWQGSVDP